MCLANVLTRDDFVTAFAVWRMRGFALFWILKRRSWIMLSQNAKLSVIFCFIRLRIGIWFALSLRFSINPPRFGQSKKHSKIDMDLNSV